MSLTVRMGTRGSALALAQTRLVIEELQRQHPEWHLVEVVIHTRGDQRSDVPFAAVGSRGIFVHELEAALFSGAIDLAVHSLKDVETHLPEGLALGAVLPRGDPRDALVSFANRPLVALPAGARIATSSIRRTALIRSLRPDVTVVPIRGNVPTRLRKAREEGFDAVVLAAAGLDRLEMGAVITERLDPGLFCPEAGQGAIVVEQRTDAVALAEAVAGISDEATATCCAAERACVAELEGTCQTPIAAYADLADGNLRLRALVCAPDGANLVRHEALGEVAEPVALGKRVAHVLLAQGAAELLHTA